MSNNFLMVSLAEVCGIESKLVDPRDSEFIDLPHVGAGNMVSMTGELIEIQTAREEGLKSGKFLFDESTVLYSKIRPYLMKCCRPDFKGLCSADVYPLTSGDEIKRDYLYYVLLTKDFTDYAISGSARAGMPKVNRNHLFSYRLPLPPLPEQERIVAILDEAFAAIATATANAEKNLANARELFESCLDRALCDNNATWVKCRLGSIVERLTNGYVGPTRSIYVDSGIPYLLARHVRNNILTFDKKTFISEEFNQKNKKSTLKRGDVLLVQSGHIGCQAPIL